MVDHGAQPWSSSNKSKYKLQQVKYTRTYFLRVSCLSREVARQGATAVTVSSIQGALEIDVVATVAGAPHQAVEVVITGASLVEAIQALAMAPNSKIPG